MKRSEMVRILRDAVQESNGDFGWYEEEQADMVLKALEEAGMRPPGYRKFVDEPIIQDGREIGTSSYKESFPGWEPE